jgi:hypothetical protein
VPAARCRRAGTPRHHFRRSAVGFVHRQFGHLHSHADDSGILNIWVVEQQRLKLCGCDLQPLDLDQLLYVVSSVSTSGRPTHLLSIHDEKMSVFIDVANVSGLHPSVRRKRLPCGLFLAPVPFHDIRSLDPNFTLLAWVFRLHLACVNI